MFGKILLQFNFSVKFYITTTVHYHYFKKKIDWTLHIKITIFACDYNQKKVPWWEELGGGGVSQLLCTRSLWMVIAMLVKLYNINWGPQHVVCPLYSLGILHFDKYIPLTLQKNSHTGSLKVVYLPIQFISTWCLA